MRQSPLFDAPPDRLGSRLHGEVFGALPSSTARALDLPEVAAAVRPLLARGWRPAQLAARVGALPAVDDPVPGVVAFLGQLLERDSPPERALQEQASRERERAAVLGTGAPASPESRAHWVSEARRTLGLPPRVLAAAAPPPAPVCASCAGHGDFFVTRQVRLCQACVQLLASGSARLATAAQAG